jgi:hypothetical protein
MLDHFIAKYPYGIGEISQKFAPYNVTKILKFDPTFQ